MDLNRSVSPSVRRAAMPETARLDASLRLQADNRSEASSPAWLGALRERERRAWQELTAAPRGGVRLADKAFYQLADAVEWLQGVPSGSIHAIVTDPPYGLVEYSGENLEKMRAGAGGVWRHPPALDGVTRSPLPRFTVLTKNERADISSFFRRLSAAALRALVPGGHMIVSSNPLLSTVAFSGLESGGLEKRGEIIRLVQTLRGGDRPKGAEREFSGVSTMARSGWEPWGVFRKPFCTTVAVNLRDWGAGGLRRPSPAEPFRDVIPCAPTSRKERALAPHPSLKPQRFLRQIVHSALPLGVGIICDPFAGSASTLAAATAVGYRSIGVDHNAEYMDLASACFAGLSRLTVRPAT